jgi:hypothetical protein
MNYLEWYKELFTEIDTAKEVIRKRAKKAIQKETQKALQEATFSSDRDTPGPFLPELPLKKDGTVSILESIENYFRSTL